MKKKVVKKNRKKQHLPLLFFLENGVTSCTSCHSILHQTKTHKHWFCYFQSLLSEKYGYQYDGENIVLQLEARQ